MRNVDDIANDYANASTDVERAALIREMDRINETLAAEHLVAGHVPEYQAVIGYTRQAHVGLSVDASRVVHLMRE